MRNRTAQYARACTSNPEHDFLSIADQRERAMDFVCDYRPDAFSFYSDVGSASTLDRPGLSTLLANAKSGCVDELLVDSLDRLSRSPEHLAQLLAQLRSAGITVHTVNDCRFISRLNI